MRRLCHHGQPRLHQRTLPEDRGTMNQNLHPMLPWFDSNIGSNGIVLSSFETSANYLDSPHYKPPQTTTISKLSSTGKFPQMGFFYKLFPHLGLFWNIFHEGALLNMPCMEISCKMLAWVARPVRMRHVAMSLVPLATPVVSPPALALWPCRVKSLVSLATPARVSFSLLFFRGQVCVHGKQQ